eukprot:506416-Pelagomonas_calceolata.AAC.1
MKLTSIALELLSSDAQTLTAMILRLSVNNVHNNAKLAGVAVFNARLLLSTECGGVGWFAHTYK